MVLAGAVGMRFALQNPRNRLPGASPSTGVLSWRGGLYSSAWSPVVPTFTFARSPVMPHSLGGQSRVIHSEVSLGSPSAGCCLPRSREARLHHVEPADCEA